MNYAVRLVSLITLMIFSSGCPQVRPPVTEKCSIINKETAECVSRNDIKDKPIKKMRGYVCMSPDDIAESNAYLQKLLEELNQVAVDAMRHR